MYQIYSESIEERLDCSVHKTFVSYRWKDALQKLKKSFIQQNNIPDNKDKVSILNYKKIK